ncbi:MAG TPA: hypothetical protein VL307_11600, partial [Chitinophagaceae bacterium]|nr:hypothetical protein [Chitinophagaceae bacterium]
MKSTHKIILAALALSAAGTQLHAQIGVGTTSPNSTLDVRGSMSLNYRAFTTSNAVTASDNMLVFTGSS